MWSWTTRLTDRIIALIDGGDFFRRPWRTGYAVIAVLLAIAGVLWAVALVSIGLYGLVRLYVEQHYVIAVQGVRAAVLLAVAMLFIAMVLARLWWMRKEDIERDTQGHKVYIVGPVVAHLVRIMGESSGLLVGFFGLLAYPVLMPARDLLDEVPLLNVLSGLYSFDWTWQVITAPVGGFLIILFSRWVGDSMEVLFAIANNTKHVAISAGQQPVDATGAERRLFTWEGAMLGLLFYLVLALPVHGTFITLPCIGLLAFCHVKGLRIAVLVWVCLSAILLLRCLMRLFVLTDDEAVAEFYLEAEPVLLIFLFMAVCAGVAFTLVERSGRNVTSLSAPQVWVIGSLCALLYALHPMVGMMREAGRRHELTSQERQQVEVLFFTYQGRKFGFRDHSGVDTATTFTVPAPQYTADLYGTIQIKHDLYVSGRKLTSEFTLGHRSIVLPDTLVYTSGGDQYLVSYLTDSILFDVAGRGSMRRAVAIAVDAYTRSVVSTRQAQADRLRLLRDSLEAEVDTLTGRYTGVDCGTDQCFVWFDVQEATGIVKRSFHCPSDIIDGYPIKALPKDGDVWRLIVRKTISAVDGDPRAGHITTMDQLVGLRPVMRTGQPAMENADRVVTPIETRPIDPGAVKVDPGYKVFGLDEVDVAPEFPGGRAGLRAYLASRQYPEAEKKAGHVAKVRVHFVVGSDGAPANIKVLNSGYPGFDAEAQRLVRAMPKWAPGKRRGSPVAVAMTVTIDFRLNE